MVLTSFKMQIIKNGMSYHSSDDCCNSRVCVLGPFLFLTFSCQNYHPCLSINHKKIASQVCISSKLYCKHNKNKITYITKKQLNTFLLNYFCFIIFHKQDDNFLSLALVLVGVEGVAGVSEGVVERARLPEGLGEDEGEEAADL